MRRRLLFTAAMASAALAGLALTRTNGASAEPEYSNGDAWLMRGSGPADARADTFYIHPTTSLRLGNGNVSYRATAIDQAPLRAQASAFDACTRIFAPCYRQATLRAQRLHNEDALNRAYGDILRAFNAYLEQAARGTTLPLQIESNGKTETIEIKIPAGVKDGSRIRIKGRGQPGHAEAGDLYIITAVRPHPYFRREGLDIYLELPLSMYEAVLGTKVQVPTLDGSVTLTVPPGTGGGAKMRIKGHGIERGTEKGDQFVEIRVQVPKGLDPEDKAIIEKLSVKYPIVARADVPW